MDASLDATQDARLASMLEDAGCELLTLNAHGSPSSHRGSADAAHATSDVWDGVAAAVAATTAMPVLVHAPAAMSNVDVELIRRETGAAGVVASTGLLHNPALPSAGPPLLVSHAVDQFLDLCAAHGARASCIRGFLAHVWHQAVLDDQDVADLRQSATLRQFRMLARSVAGKSPPTLACQPPLAGSSRQPDDLLGPWTAKRAKKLDKASRGAKTRIGKRLKARGEQGDAGSRGEGTVADQQQELGQAPRCGVADEGSRRPNKAEVKAERRQRLRAAMHPGAESLQVAVDLSMDGAMSEKEVASLCDQIRRLYGANLRSEVRVAGGGMRPLPRARHAGRAPSGRQLAARLRADPRPARRRRAPGVQQAGAGVADPSGGTSAGTGARALDGAGRGGADPATLPRALRRL